MPSLKTAGKFALGVLVVMLIDATLEKNTGYSIRRLAPGVR